MRRFAFPVARVLVAAALMIGGWGWVPSVAPARAALPPPLSSIGLQPGDVSGFTPVSASDAALNDVHDQGPSQAFVTCAGTDPLLTQLGGGPAASISRFYGQGRNSFGTPALLIASAVFGDGSVTHAVDAYTTVVNHAFQSCWAQTTDALNRAQGVTVPTRPSTVSTLTTPHRLGSLSTGFAVDSTISALGTTLHLQATVTAILTGPVLALLFSDAYDQTFPDTVRDNAAARIAARMASMVPQPPSTSTPPSGAQGTPAPRVGAALVYDGATGQLVLFGGFASADGRGLSDTWTWDGAAWHQAASNNAAAGYIGQLGAAFDGRTGQLLAVSGAPGSTPTTALKTWQWTPAGWRSIFSAHSPPFGAGDLTIAFDAKIGEIVLLVGTWPHGPAVGDPTDTETWAWTGSDWLQLHPTVAAPPALDQQLTFDPVSRLLLREGVGGYQGAASVLAQTWGFNGTTWFQLRPDLHPKPALGAAMANSSSPQTVVRIGGRDGSAPCGDSTDEWSWSQGHWTAGSLPPGVQGRSGAALAMDHRTSQLVMFGGCSSNRDGTNTFLNDTVILTGQGAVPGSSASTCRYTTSAPPAVVVVLLMGLNSSLPSGHAYDVRSIDYCQLDKSDNAQLKAVGDTFDKTGPGSTGSLTLAQAIGQQGAVILPYSYRGAYFTGPDIFYAAGYDSQTPNASDVIADAAVLDDELSSIRRQWPSTRIVVVGHSLGGLVAKQWWRNWDGSHSWAPDHARRSWQVPAVFSLDGPINGGPTEDAQWTPAGNCPNDLPLPFSTTSQLPCGLLAMEFSALWHDYAMKGDDLAMAATDSGDRGIYTPIGTRGDIVMEALRGPVGINDNGEELGVQLFAKFNGDGTVDTLLAPGAISGQDAHASQLLDSHGVVYRDATNIARIAAAVRDAAQVGRPLVPAPVHTSALISPVADGGRPLPAVILPTPIAPNGVVTLHGTHLGSSPGQLRVISAQTSSECSISSWSETDATCKVDPHTPSGYVIGQTASGQPLYAGAVLIPAPAPAVTAVEISAPRSAKAPAGTAQTVLVTVRNGARPAPATPLEVLIGDTPVTLRTGATGSADLTVSGLARTRIVAAAGSRTASSDISWQPNAAAKLALATHWRSKNSATVTVTVETADGRPVSGLDMWTGVIAPEGSAGAATRHATTGADGTIRINVRAQPRGAPVVWAATADGRHDAAMTVTGEPQKTTSGPPTTFAIPIAIAIACLLAAAVIFTIRARRRRGYASIPSGDRRRQP